VVVVEHDWGGVCTFQIHSTPAPLPVHVFPPGITEAFEGEQEADDPVGPVNDEAGKLTEPLEQVFPSLMR
jgi:hypothetical protein